jgi:hypothetical protein
MASKILGMNLVILGNSLISITNSYKKKEEINHKNRKILLQQDRLINP